MKHTAYEVIDIYENHISPIFDQSKAVYSDNRSHYVNQKVQDYFQERRGTHFTRPVSHPSSTRLLERTVQSMMSYLKGRSIDWGSTKAWPMGIGKGVVFVNNKSQKIHGSTPAGLMLGFSPQIKHFDVEWKRPNEANLEIEDTTEHQKHIYMVLQDEDRCLASEALVYFYYRREQREKKQWIPKVGDLILVTNHAVDGKRGRILESK